MITTPPASEHRSVRVATMVVAVSIAALLLTIVPAGAQDLPATGSSEAACLEDVQTGAPFADVVEGTTHAAAISCLWAYGVASGSFDDGQQVFRPADTVTREQMTSFLVRTLDQLPARLAPLPDPQAEPDFIDAADISGAHVESVLRLTDLGIVQGFDDASFRPAEPVTRAQMATFLARAIEEVVGEELDRATGFEDVAGVHRPGVEKLATIGVVQGTAPGVYSPAAPIERQQMATLLARTLSFFVDQGLLQPLAFQPGDPGVLLGLTDVDVAARDGFDRVTFTLEGDDGEAGWRMRYVDEARQDGSGNPVEVDGDAVLEVRLEGLALPFDLPDDVEERLWDQGRVSLDGDAIVEIVDAGVFEGQQQLFIGTRGLLAFEVARLDDPQRVYVDVQHPS